MRRGIEVDARGRFWLVIRKKESRNMPSKSLSDLDPRLRDAFEQLKSRYEATYPDTKVLVTCTYRSPEEQAALYAQGRTSPGRIVTMCDGKTHLSKHNCYPAKAFDVVISVCGRGTWSERFYADLGALAAEIGVKWGGTFKSFKDLPHFEI